MENVGIIVEQQFVESFVWKKLEYNKYLVRFKEYEGFHLINRWVEYEQALIGAKIIFDYSVEQSKITRYKVLKYIPMNELKKINS